MHEIWWDPSRSNGLYAGETVGNSSRLIQLISTTSLSFNNCVVFLDVKAIERERAMHKCKAQLGPRGLHYLNFKILLCIN